MYLIVPPVKKDLHRHCPVCYRISYIRIQWHKYSVSSGMYLCNEVVYDSRVLTKGNSLPPFPLAMRTVANSE